MRRIDLASKTVGPAVSLGRNDISKLSAGQIAAVPGSSTQYMVSLRQPGFEPDYAGLALYDGTTLLTALSSFYGSGDSIAFIDHSTLMGCSNLLSPSELVRYSVTSTAITPGTYVDDIIADAARTRIAFGSGWIFASDGHAVNAATLEPLGRYGDGLIASGLHRRTLPRSGRSERLVPERRGRDRHGFAGLRPDDVSTASNRFARPPAERLGPGQCVPLVRWSPTGFAFRTYEKLYLIKLPN